MIDAKRFSGVLNTDDKPENVAGPQHIDAKNVRFYGGPSGLTAENIKGNYLINNAQLPDGLNECIGSFFDSVNQRIIWFNYNSAGNNGIYKLDLQTETVSKIFLCNTDTATDILNFSPDYPVHSCNLVYRTPGDGDLLYWTDGNNRPRYLNLDTVSSLAPFTEDMINAAKNAPLTPPDLEYQDDVNFKTNNLRKKLFRACYRWVYSNGEKSTFSPISKVPLPVNGYDVTTNAIDTYNNRIQITVTGGGDDYTAIEVAGQFNINNVWSDFFLIDSLDATQYNIAPGGTYNYRFYNDSTYTPIDPQETDLYFSWLPNKANTLELLNGNVLIYGGITDGYDLLQRDEVDVVITSSLSSSGGSVPTITYGYSGPRSIYVYIGPVIQTGAVYNVTFNYTNSVTPPVITYTSNDSYTTIGGDTQASIATSLAALINNPGFITATATGGGYIFITVSSGIGSITNVVVTATGTGGVVTPGPSWKWSCPGRLGLVYFDDRGKTNGVISYVADNVLDNTDFAFYTPAFGTSGGVPQTPVVNASINHTPPTWATSYQWVRANLLPTSFIYWVTSDYQTDSTYLYFCIQNLTEQKEKDTGFVPSYEFTQGDRVRVIASYTGSAFSPYVDGSGQPFQQDMAILGTVERTMASPATNGTFLKVYNTGSFPTASYQQKMLIEIYSPRQKNTSETELFFEWGEKYDIYTLLGNRYHRGQIADQTSTQPATFEWKEGDVYFKPRTFYTNVGSPAVVNTQYFQDANYSDYFVSAVNSNGRAWVVDSLAAEEYNSVMIRWGGKYQDGTTINELPIFRPNDLDMADRSKGDIQRFKSRDRILRVFQDRGTGQYGVYMRFIQNNQGQSELVTTNEIITTNNIQYYQGVYGVSGYPTNLVSTQNADYFVDVVTGRAIRLGGNGLTDLGLAYKGQFFLSQLVLPYNKSITRAGGFTSKIMGLFNYFDNQYNVLLQGSISQLIIQSQSPFELSATYELYLNGEPKTGDVISIELTDSLSTTQTYSYTVLAGDTVDDIITGLVADINGGIDFVATSISGSPYSHLEVVSAYPLITVEGITAITYNTTGDVTPYNFSFNETRNGFCSFYDFHPEWATGANDMVYTWKNGEIWKHDDPTYCNFYGDQYNASVTVVFNNNLLGKKSWHSINEIASGIWAVPSMYTNTKSYGSTNQLSNLVDAEFTILEGNPSSAIKRDSNSQGGKINGDFMKGNYLVAKFEKQNASNYITLSEVSVRTTDSPLTAK